nr:MFS transporter [Streptomyces sp. San01]
MTSPAPSRSPLRPRRPAWAGRNYGLLAGAAFVTTLGSHGALIASAFAVLDAGGDGGDVGLVAASRTLTLVLFLLVGGAVADRLPRHHVMVAANALNFLSQGAFALLVLTGEPSLWQMMLLSALGGTGQAFFNPAAEGMLMSSVTGEQASRAFALFRMAMSGAAVGGAALGGAMVAAIGPGWVLAVDAVAFAVAGALRSFLEPRCDVQMTVCRYMPTSDHCGRPRPRSIRQNRAAGARNSPSSPKRTAGAPPSPHARRRVRCSAHGRRRIGARGTGTSARPGTSRTPARPRGRLRPRARRRAS